MRALLAGCVLLVCAACGSVGGAGSATRSSQPSSTASVLAASSPSGSAAPSSGAVTSSTTDACGLLARTDVQTIIGTVTDQPTQTATAMTGVADKAAVCAWRGATGLLTVAVLSKAMAEPDFDVTVRGVPGAKPVPGIGDSAYGISAGTGGANGATILVLKGTTYFTIVATSSSNDASSMLESLKTLAKKVAGEL